jgi:hypothetical protein
MFLFPLIALAVVVLAAILALFSAHIPLLRDWTGAATLQDDDTARNFAASESAEYVTRPDWEPAPARPQLPEAATSAITAREVAAP